ncbi:hypothetical protein [Bailinhaonella thermotolerans]|uniref:Uncharacterized protein n=1 Tax=Bailinhaonella thermotolerans TaxID=1070861 RepID=A0A3A4AA12_9ACTN|nr:hypothetical protein [Bailinhaonella thermotolerans]RJL23184.1 hypothetical protein D5H75_32920 [Bailinhaonella thermotolerans]
MATDTMREISRQQDEPEAGFCEVSEEVAQEHAERLDALGEVLRGHGLRTLLVRRVCLNMRVEQAWGWARYGRPELIVAGRDSVANHAAWVGVLDTPDGPFFVAHPADERFPRVQGPVTDPIGVADGVVQMVQAMAAQAGEVA